MLGDDQDEGRDIDFLIPNADQGSSQETPPSVRQVAPVSSNKKKGKKIVRSVENSSQKSLAKLVMEKFFLKITPTRPMLLERKFLRGRQCLLLL